jgi:hypothetical protein
MLSPALRKELQRPVRLLNLTWWAFMAAVPLYGLIAVLPGKRFDEPPVTGQHLLIIFGLAALVSLAFSLLFRRRAFTDVALKRALGNTSPSGQGDARRLEQHLLNLMPYIQTQMIIVWAAAEAVAIFGLLLVYLRFDPLIALPFGAVALLGILYHRPRPEQILERAAELVRRN